jgi:hypothetical protein
MKKLYLFYFLLCLNSFYSQVPSYLPTNGLLAYYPFSSNANDVSGNGNNGTVNGATLNTDRFGNTSNAYYFSGINCQTNISANINTNTIDLTNEYTVSFWVNKTSTGCQTQPRLMEFYSSSIGSLNFNWDVVGNDYLMVETINSTGIYQSTSYYYNNWVNNWINVSFSVKSNDAKLYINGVLVSNFIFSGLPRLASNVNFGRMNHPSYNTMNGLLDDIGIWNRALTQQEITNLYYADSNCQSLVINTGLLSFNPPTYANTVTIYPNPANDHITIDCGTLANVSGWNIVITNTLGQEVFNQPMNTQQYVVPLNTWSGQGVYFVKIYNAQGTLVNTKKIILQ